jgi:hypothetical protein
VASLYTNNKHTEKEIRKITSNSSWCQKIHETKNKSNHGGERPLTKTTKLKKSDGKTSHVRELAELML